MPKEARKRGRREAKKRAELRQKEEEEAATQAAYNGNEDQNDNWDEGYYDGYAGEGDGMPFYGLLDEQESEYFRKADEILELNAFGSPEEKALFIENVYKEAEGKELKIASSQGCSRLLERLISLSTSSQLKSLLQIFSGNYSHLVSHRFASHVCETLFIHAAPAVTAELNPNSADVQPQEGEVFASMETLILSAVLELEPTFLDLLTNTFASHTARVLLVVLSGQALADDMASRSLKSKKKEDVSAAAKVLTEKRIVPIAFLETLDRILADVSSKLSVERIRQLAVDPLGSPSLSSLIQAEFMRARSKKGKLNDSIYRKLTSGVVSNEEEKTEQKAEGEKDQDQSGSSFFNNLMYDSVGSHLVEALVTKAPKKEFSKIYSSHIKPRVGQIARNELGGFIVQRLLNRLSKPDLQHAALEIAAQVPNLIERGRTSVIKALVDACAAHEVDTALFVEPIKKAYECENPDNQKDLILKILRITPETLLQEPSGENGPIKKDPVQLHSSLLAQSLLQLPGELGNIIRDSITLQPPEVLFALCQNSVSSYFMQECLKSSHSNAVFKRKFLNNLRGEFAELATDPSGSHVIDECWNATLGMTNYRQLIAEELAAAEASLRDSFYGRNVWRNWKMDKYNTRRREWLNEGKTFKDDDSADAKVATTVAPAKTPLQLARERHAAKKNGTTEAKTKPQGKRAWEPDTSHRKTNIKRPRL